MEKFVAIMRWLDGRSGVEFSQKSQYIFIDGKDYWIESKSDMVDLYCKYEAERRL